MTDPYFQTPAAVIVPTATMVAPTLTAPANGATGVSLTPTLQWSGGSATYWEVNISKGGTIIHTKGGLPASQMSYAVPSGVLQAGVQYVWDVSACPTTACTTGFAVSANRTFTTAIQPGAFMLSNDPPYWDSRDPAGPAVQLLWTASSNATSYEVYRNGTKIYPTSGAFSGTTFRNEIGLTSGQTYSFYIIAQNSSGSRQSNTISVGPMPSAPATPTVRSVTPSAITQGNSYQDVTISGTNFTTSSWHQFSTDGGVTWVPAQSAPTITSATSMTVGVNNTIVRTVRIRVCASFGSSVCSGSIAVTIQAATGEIASQLTDVLPTTIPQGSSSQNVTLTGTAFASVNRYQGLDHNPVHPAQAAIGVR
jgi:hypothetical protein